MDLIDCIKFIKDRQAKLPEYQPHGDNEERLLAIETMARDIGDQLPKAKISERWDGASVSIMGVRATSTSGINNALMNWIKAARRKLDQTSFVQSTGEKENVR